MFSAAMAGVARPGDYLTGKLGRAHLVALRGSFGRGRTCFRSVVRKCRRSQGFSCAGAGLATIIPNTFAATGNIEGSAPGPCLAVVSDGWLHWFPGGSTSDRVCRAAFLTIRSALWILVVLTGLSALCRTISMRRNFASQKNALRSAKMPSRLRCCGRRRCEAYSPSCCGACLHDFRLRNEVRICHGFLRFARLAHIGEVVLSDG